MAGVVSCRSSPLAPLAQWLPALSVKLIITITRDMAGDPPSLTSTIAPPLLASIHRVNSGDRFRPVGEQSVILLLLAGVVVPPLTGLRLVLWGPGAWRARLWACGAAVTGSGLVRPLAPGVGGRRFRTGSSSPGRGASPGAGAR